MDRSVSIIGAGIAGLSCALALARIGAKVQIFEQAGKITEIGAGLQITPNGVAVLDALGLGEQLRAAAQPTTAVCLRDYRRGKLVLRLDMQSRGAGRPYLILHRADLIGLLAKAAQEAGVTIRLGQMVESISLDGDVPVVSIVGGQTHKPEILVGADGLHSRLRSALACEQKPNFTGQVAWRAIVDGSQSDDVNVFMGPGRHLVSYPLRGGKFTNIVAVEEHSDWADEGWHHPGVPDELRRAFSSFCPQVGKLLDQIEQTNIWGLFRHPVAKNWHRGQSVIIGDAAHPTLPFLAQGANMALEDGWELADCIGHLPIEQALPAFQQRRFSRVSKIVAAADANARNYHLRNPVIRMMAHTGLRIAGAVAPDKVVGKFDWVYGYDATRQ